MFSSFFTGDRLSGAIVSAGKEVITSKQSMCGLPMTTEQASILGAHIKFVCDLVFARYVSVRLPENRAYLTLCEVIVEEFRTEHTRKQWELY